VRLWPPFLFVLPSGRHGRDHPNAKPLFSWMQSRATKPDAALAEGEHVFAALPELVKKI
jgi:hypothetical protein